jgi:hypothetical protein
MAVGRGPASKGDVRRGEPSVKVARGRDITYDSAGKVILSIDNFKV